MVVETVGCATALAGAVVRSWGPRSVALAVPLQGSHLDRNPVSFAFSRTPYIRVGERPASGQMPVLSGRSDSGIRRHGSRCCQLCKRGDVRR